MHVSVILVLWTRVAKKKKAFSSTLDSIYWRSWSPAPTQCEFEWSCFGTNPCNRKLTERLQQLLSYIFLLANNHLLAIVFDESLLLAFFIKEFGLTIPISFSKMEKWQSWKEGGRGRTELISVKEKFGPEKVCGGWWRRGGECRVCLERKRIGVRREAGIMNSFFGRLFYLFWVLDIIHWLSWIFVQLICILSTFWK